MKRTAFYAAVLLVTALVGTTWAGKNEAESQVLLQLELVDGSRVIGVPDSRSIALKTSYAGMDVLWKEILKIEVREDHETASLYALNGDVLKGVINIGSIRLETIFGKVTIGIEHIREIRASLCEIVVTATAPVSVEELAPGIARLSGDYTPTFDAVAGNLSGARFLRVPWKATPSYTVTVVKPGLLYQLQNAGNLRESSNLKWEKADPEIAGAYLNERYRTRVEKGQSFECSGYELSFIAKRITMK